MKILLCVVLFMLAMTIMQVLIERSVSKAVAAQFDQWEDYPYDTP